MTEINFSYAGTTVQRALPVQIKFRAMINSIFFSGVV